MDPFLLILIGLNVLVSMYAWRNEKFFRRFCMNPYSLVRNNQFDRIITHAFLHGGQMHLFINMIVLWSFGTALLIYIDIFIEFNKYLIFTVLYLGAILASSISDIVKHKDNYQYNSVGASGATSAVVFACIFFAPWHMLYFFGIIPIPGIVFGLIYLIYSYRMAKTAKDNIGHDAHFWGAVFGFVFFIVVKPDLFKLFINQLLNF